MPLDSDVSNGDEKLYVEFYIYEAVGPKSDPAQIGKTFIRIVTPGNQLNVVDRPMRESDQRRFPRHWLIYQQMNTGAPVVGLDLGVWLTERPDDLTRNQMDQLRALKFLTVEHVATASDAQLQRIGMGGIGLRDRAAAFLAEHTAKKATGDVDALKQQNADMAAQLAAMQEQMAALMAAPPKNKGGRPAKVKPEAAPATA